MLVHHASVLLTAAALSTACAEHHALLERGPSGAPSPVVFWPPSPATSVWTATAEGATFGDVAAQVTRALDLGGYPAPRWYPIGLDCAHGFAAVTRLEHIDGDGSPARDRWSSLYSEPSNLRWLDLAREPRLPGAGRFRVFLVAFTDLPVSPGERAPRWNDETVMDAPAMPPMHLPAHRAVTSRFRVSTLIYEYAASEADERGSFLATDDRLSPAAHMRGARLTALAGSR